MRTAFFYLAIMIAAACPAQSNAQQDPPGADVPPPGANDPLTVGDFVKRCSSIAGNPEDEDRCRDIINWDAMMQKTQDANSVCLTSDPAKSRDVLDAVAQWLQPRTGLRSEPKEQGIAAALSTLYPCPKR